MWSTCTARRSSARSACRTKRRCSDASPFFVRTGQRSGWVALENSLPCRREWAPGTSSSPFRFHAVALGRKTRAGLVTAARARTRSGGLQAEDRERILSFCIFSSDSERSVVYAVLNGSRADSCRSTYGFSGRRILQRVGDARPLWKMIRLLPLPTFRPPFFVLLLTSFLSRLPFSSFLSHSSSLTLSYSPPPSLSLSFFIRHRE